MNRKQHRIKQVFFNKIDPKETQAVIESTIVSRPSCFQVAQETNEPLLCLFFLFQASYFELTEEGLIKRRNLMLSNTFLALANRTSQ